MKTLMFGVTVDKSGPAVEVGCFNGSYVSDHVYSWSKSFQVHERRPIIYSVVSDFHTLAGRSRDEIIVLEPVCEFGNFSAKINTCVREWELAQFAIVEQFSYIRFTLYSVLLYT